jgi:hypothetical protein
MVKYLTLIVAFARASRIGPRLSGRDDGRVPRREGHLSGLRLPGSLAWFEPQPAGRS